MKFANLLMGLVLALAVAAGAMHDARPAQAAITLTPISTAFNGMIGIDHHEPTNKVLVSVNYSSGSPHNFELVAADGSRTTFSDISGLTDEVKIATVRTSTCMGGFLAGQAFTGTGVDGVIARISPDGTVVDNPWVSLPGDGNGLMRGSIFQDRYCAFGGDLIAVTTNGEVWRITSAGVPTKLIDFLTGTHLEGVTTVPDDPAKYGPWAGKILAGAEGEGCIYAIEDDEADCYELGINPEDFDIIPDNENFYGVNYPSALQGAPASAFDGMEGDILVTQESPGQLWRVSWNGDGFDTELLASVSQWEHVTFSPAGIVEIPPTGKPEAKAATVIHYSNHTALPCYKGAPPCNEQVAPAWSEVHDLATVTSSIASITPTGSVTFAFYNTNLHCMGRPASTESVALAGSGGVATAESSSTAPLGVGSYSYKAVYFPDGAAKEAGFVTTPAPCEQLGIVKVDPKTDIHLGDHTALPCFKGAPPCNEQVAPAGAVVHDLAKIASPVAGINPTGSVNFAFFAGNAHCMGRFTSAEKVTVVAANGLGTAESSEAGPLEPGEYSYKAVYVPDAAAKGLGLKTMPAPCEQLLVREEEPVE